LAIPRLLRLIPLLVASVFALVALAPSVVDGAGKETKQPAKPAVSKTAPLDINSASVDELKALPGVGETYSKRIVAGRPYKQKDELVQRKILPQDTYDKIKDQIARQK
jgi:competence protein ComEA